MAKSRHILHDGIVCRRKKATSEPSAALEHGRHETGVESLGESRRIAMPPT
jgi:hypothetical protein